MSNKKKEQAEGEDKVEYSFVNRTFLINMPWEAEK
jgi:hypothetical protein